MALAQTKRTPILTTPHFAIYSDFDTNLNDALIAAGLARHDKKPELFHSGAETSCFDTLPASTRAAWDAAVDHFAKNVSPSGWDGREQFLLRMQLVGFDDEWRRSGAADVVEKARSIRADAAPAYRTCRWTVQDTGNRQWIADLTPRLATDELKISTRIEQLYQTRWKTLPILVDVVETVNWSGASTTWSKAGQGDIVIANVPQGASGLETLFHEASHVLMDRGDPLRQALDRAASAAAFRQPNDLWHVVLFFTTGEIVRQILGGDVGHDGPAYTPMLYEIFARGTWASYRQALENSWLPYIKGERSLDEAATSLIAALRKTHAGQ